MKAEKRIELTHGLNPEVVDLARWVCLATRIDPALIRRARLRLLSGSNAGTESDLWFSPLVQTVGARYILFYPEVSDLLRHQLAANRKDFTRAWKVTRKAHRSLPELMRLEEKLTWLSLKDGPRIESKLDALIRPIIKAILTGKREGLGRWALNVLPNLPERARNSKSARLLRVIAESQLYGGWANLLTTVGDGPTDEEAALLLVGLDRTRVGLRFQGNTIEVSEPPEEGARLIDVPATNPRVLELSWIDNFKTFSARLMWKSGERSHAANVTLPLSLSTLAGDSHQLTTGNEMIEACRKSMAPYVVSILDAGNKPVGLGILVENDFVLTTVHSIRNTYPDSVDRLRSQPVGFPLLKPERIAMTSPAGSAVPPEGAFSQYEPMSMDYPMLFKLHASESGTRPANLKSAFDLTGRVLLAPGMSSDGNPDNWAAFKVGEATETGDFALIPATQISSDNLSRWSGAPLVDSSTGEVAGLVLVNKGQDARARLASLDQISRAFPAIFNAGFKIAVSYVHEDIKYVDELKSRIETLVVGEKVVFWEGWYDEIAREINSVTAVVLFVSAHYLASDLMIDERLLKLFREAEERGVVVLPVLLSPSRFMNTPLARYQAVNDPHKPLDTLSKHERDQVFERLSETLSKQLGVKVDEDGGLQPEFSKDFFISYHDADRAWAKWIAWQLEEAGYSTVLDLRDFRPGTDFVLEMERAMKESARTIALLSPDYLDAEFARPEWIATLVHDRRSERPRLLPVRVRESRLTGLWSSLQYIDFVGLSESVASAELVKEIKSVHPRSVAANEPQSRSIERVPFPGVPPPIPKLSTDIFISFAQLDNRPFDEEKGWVNVFAEHLRVQLSQLLGFEPNIWLPTELQGGTGFVTELGDRLADSYLFVAIVTPAFIKSEWCLQELKEFHRHATETQLTLGTQPRIFVVQKLPVESVPDELSDLLRYEFYDFDTRDERPQQFSPQLSPELGQRYLRKLANLAWDMHKRLLLIRPGRTPPP